MTRDFPWWRSMVGSRNMASCLELGRVLQSYVDGEIDEVTARRVARHLERCRRCGLDASTYAEIKHAVARRGGPVPDEVLERLRQFGKGLVEDSPGEAG